jgi:thioesterase domain-containing protein
VTGWEKVCRQLEVQEVPGDHHSCIALNSNVTPIGETMKKAIDRAESLLTKKV